jgi:acyl-coenzyme A thioesterase PaaI-like protein
MKQSVTELPFNRLLGIEAASGPEQVLRLPGGEQYTNHLGTVHAGALLALAEASSGEYLLRAVGTSEGVVPVVRRIEAKFRKPANGAVTSTVTTAPGAIERLREELAGKGRASISVAVELRDESGVHVLTAAVEWFMARVGGSGVAP